MSALSPSDFSQIRMATTTKGPVNVPQRTANVNSSQKVSNPTYDGVKDASAYLKEQGVPRDFRKQHLESFDVRTIKMENATDSTYGLRFHDGGINASEKGRYLFETFTPQTNRNNLALPPEWNGMTGINQFQVRKVTPMITGNAAPQPKMGSQYVGGAKQWYINNLEDLIKHGK